MDCGKNAFEITKNVVIPESEHSESFVDQATIADRVCSGLVVLSAVNFNNDKSFPADEIADVTAYGLLSYKFMPFDLPVANAVPENSFRIRLIGAQLSREGSPVMERAQQYRKPTSSVVASANRGPHATHGGRAAWGGAPFK